MCGSGASRHTTSGGLSSSGKVASLSIHNMGVVLDLSYIRVKIPGNPRMLWSDAVSTTLAMI